MFKTGVNNKYVYRIVYLLFILFFIILAYSFRQPIFVCFIFMLLLIIAFSHYALKSSYPKICFLTADLPESIECEQVLTYPILIENQSLFPLTECSIHFRIQNRFCPAQDTTMLVTALPSKKKTRLLVPISLAKCGMLEITMIKINLFDYLHTVQISYDIHRTVSIPVLPSQKKITLPGRLFSGEGDEEIQSDSIKATSSPDVIDFREYRPGDSLHRINWKLTSKTDILLLKETAAEQSVSLTVLINLDPSIIHSTIITSSSLIYELVRNQELFYLAFSNQDNSFDRILIRDNQTAKEAIIQLFYAPVAPDNGSILMKYRMLNPADQSILYVKGEHYDVSQQ